MQENLEIDKGTILKEARIRKGLTQEQLAKEINYTRQYISRWENGSGFPKDIKTLKKLSDLLSIPLKKILPEDYLIVNNDDLEKNSNVTDNKANKSFFKNIIIVLIVIISIIVAIYAFKTNIYKIDADCFTGVFSNNIQNRYLEIHSKEPLKNFSKITLYTYDEFGRKDILNSSNTDNVMQEKIFVNPNEYNLKLIKKCGLFGTVFYKDGKLDNIAFLLNQENSDNIRAKNNCKLSENKDSNILLKYGFEKDNNSYLYVDKNINIYYDGKEFEAISNGDNDQYSLIPTSDYGFYYYNLVKQNESNDIKMIKYDATKDCSIEKCNNFKDYAEFINLLNKVLEYNEWHL